MLRFSNNFIFVSMEKFCAIFHWIILFQSIFAKYILFSAWSRQSSKLGQSRLSLSAMQFASSQTRVQTRSPLSMIKRACRRVQKNNTALWVVEISATSTKTQHTEYSVCCVIVADWQSLRIDNINMCWGSRKLNSE